MATLSGFRFRIQWIAVCAACLLGGFAVGRTTRTASLLPSFAPIVESVHDAVVGIRAFGGGRDGSARWSNQGAGVAIDSQGRVLTALHLVDGADFVEVLVPRLGLVGAEVIGSDPATDVALLDVDLEAYDADSWAYLSLASNETVRQGDWVLAVGSPMGFSHTVSAGIVAFVGRHLDHDEYALTTEHLQISALSAPGSSGGPVLSMGGQVLGLTTRAGAPGAGLMFAVPARSLRRVLYAMRGSSDGVVRRGWAGVSLLDLPSVEEPGVQIADLVESGPGDRAGLEVGDVVLRLDDHEVFDVLSLHDQLTWSPPGSVVDLEVLRDGESVRLTLEMADPRDAGPVSGARGPEGTRATGARRGG